jgi:ornithine cyclodeaminase/alanine dehydrogenase-like protein (mu-crystallin family)
MSDGLRYLSASDVIAAMPPIAERLALAERTMTALVADAELPPKIGVHPRPEGSFAHAMPALLRPAGARAAGTGAADPASTGPASTADDLLGIKWVTGFGENQAHGLPSIHALVIVNDAATGVPTAILDGGAITAQRTAAVSGVAIERFAPSRARRAAIIGAGVQGRSHLEVVGHLLAGVELSVYDRHPERAAALAEAARATPGIASAEVAPSAREATGAADVVITAASFTTPDRRGTLTVEWLTPDALVVAVDYATMVAASVAHDAALFLTDERDQFLANRNAGQFDGYPDPGATLGEAILAGTPRPPNGRVLVSHLGVGLADIVFAEAILRRAQAAGLGTNLEH